MTTEDRLRWDAWHAADRERCPADRVEPAIPPIFAPYGDLFPESGAALDLACGNGASSVWLAIRGLEVCGVDVSPVAVDRAGQLAARHGVGDRCRFEVADLDLGLPATGPGPAPAPACEVILCHLFRDQRVYPQMTTRLKPGGLLAIAVLSEVGGEPGEFRARAGELDAAFGDLDVVAGGEGDGRAWMLARKPTPWT